MRIVAPSPARRRRFGGISLPATSRAARIERLGLVAVSLLMILGFWLVASEQLASSGGCTPSGAGSPGEGCVNLSTVTSAAQLEPLLHTFPDVAERRAVAAALFAHLEARRAALEHVGGLAAATIPATAVAADPRLKVLNARLKERPSSTAVPILTPVQVAALKPGAVVRAAAEYRHAVLLIAALFVVGFWCAHLVRWWAGTTGDAVLLPAVHLLTGLGLMTLLALRDPLRDMMIAGTAAWGVLTGCLLWAAVSFIDFERPAWRRMFLPPLAAAVVLAAALLMFGGGPAGSGAKVNLLGAQPVELIRPLVVLALAGYFAKRWQFLREFSERVGPSASVRRHVQLPRWKDVRPLGISLATLLLFFFLQKDLGPALVLSCVFLGLYGVARGRVALVAAGFAVLAAGFALGHAFGIPGTVAQRVAMWLDPWENARVGGDQIAHALWALATGAVSGLGPGVGDPQLIPAGHTDLVVAALGEDLGFIGVLAVLVISALIVWRMLSIALRAPGDYSFFLATGLAIALTAQGVVIVGGLLGLMPLAGVVTPFLSYGRSSMLSNVVAVAIVCAVARRRGEARQAFVVPMRALRWTMAVAALTLLARTTLVQVVDADSIAARANLTQQADGGYRYQYNPRLVQAARGIPRGTIFDRNGVPLATNDPEVVRASADRLRSLGADPCAPTPARCYPLGPAAFHLLGDADHQVNWAASNTAYVERTFDATLRGFDDQARVVPFAHPITGAPVTALRRDYRELLPIVRHKANRSHPDVQRILARQRDVHLTVDAGLQRITAGAVRRAAIESGSGRAAAIVVDPETGALLASASYPWPDARELRGEIPVEAAHLLDRPRFGLYPPGSTFKIVTAAAALRGSTSDAAFDCVRLPDGRVGGRVPGVTRPIRDDAKDVAPHGRLDLHRALVVSCNAYFANLARTLGSRALAETAAAAQISIASSSSDARLRETLPHAGYGQGDVVATPLRMARVVGAVATDGVLRDVVMQAPHDSRSGAATGGTRWLDENDAKLLRRDLRAVVTSGTGRTLASHAVDIAGKTGTAEVDGRPSHAWFVGFAPYSQPRIAFSVVVENAGYGGRVAAPLAGEIVSAARTRGLLRRETPAAQTRAEIK